MTTTPVNDSNTELTNDAAAAEKPFAVHLLDVGGDPYGDAVLCRFGAASVLFDGAHRKNYETEGSHPSIPSQLGELLGQPGPTYTVDLLVVTHLHDDHIGCLPELVQRDWLRANWVLAIDPGFRWGVGADADALDTNLNGDLRGVVSALQEEPRTGVDDHALNDLMADSVSLQQRYGDMLTNLVKGGAKIVRYGTSPEGEEKALRTSLLEEKGVSLDILGPRKSDMKICAEKIKNWSRQTLDTLAGLVQADSASGPLDLYRQIISAEAASDKPRSAGSFINLESLVISLTYMNKRFLFTGDMQMGNPETDDAELVKGNATLLNEIAKHAPYNFVKLSHHGSWNGLSEGVLEKLKDTKLFGLCTGSKSLHHPSPSTLDLLKKHGLNWVRTDRNGRITITFSGERPAISLSSGKVDDATPPSGPSGHPATPTSDNADSGQLRISSSRVGPFDGRESDISLSIPRQSQRVTIVIDLATEP